MRWSDIPFRPPESMLRQFAGLWLVAFGAIAAWQGLAKGRPVVGAAIAVVAVAVGVLGMARPRAIRPVFVGWMVLAFPIGWAVSNALLLLIFVGLFVPLGLAFRVLGRDALDLKAPAGRSTYWRPRRPPADVGRYFRQY